MTSTGEILLQAARVNGARIGTIMQSSGRSRMDKSGKTTAQASPASVHAHVSTSVHVSQAPLQSLGSTPNARVQSEIQHISC